MVTTKITIKKHLAEYCIGKWGEDFSEPVAFPSLSDLYITVFDLLQKRPSDCYHMSGNLEIVIPCRRSNEELGFRKNPEVYNYLSHRSCGIIERRIESLFWSDIHQFLDERRLKGIQNLESIHFFMCMYKIESISEDALIKNYYRWRENIRKRSKRMYQKSRN
jgi:hypothetical protein